MQGPETFLIQLQVALPSPVDPSLPATLSPEFRTVVNGHLFWVSGEAELERFRAAPEAYTGPLLDPTRHEWFDPEPDSPRLDADGEILLFASLATRDAYPGTPSEATPGGELDFGADRPPLPAWARHVHGTPSLETHP